MALKARLSFAWSQVKLACRNITVEPAFFLYTLARMMEPSALNYMLIYKTCRIDFGLSEDICNNLEDEENEEYEDMVLDEFTQFGVYTDLIQSILPLFFAFYIGAWCDLFGRKLIVYMYWAAKVISQVIVILNTVYLEEWKKEWFYFAYVPVALVGKLKRTIYLKLRAIDTLSRCLLLSKNIIAPIKLSISN